MSMTGLAIDNTLISCSFSRLLLTFVRVVELIKSNVLQQNRGHPMPARYGGKILRPIMIIAILGIFMIIGVSYWFSVLLVEKSAERNLTLVVDGTARSISLWFADSSQEVDYWGKLPITIDTLFESDPSSKSAKRLSLFFQDVVSGSERWGSISLIKKSGLVLASSSPARTGRQVSHIHTTGVPTTLGLHENMVLPSYLSCTASDIVITAPVLFHDQPIGILSATIPLTQLVQRFITPLRIADERCSYFLSRTGVPLSSLETYSPPFPDAFFKNTMLGKTKGFHILGTGEDRRAYAFAECGRTGFTLVVADSLAWSTDFTRYLGLFLLFAGSIVFLMVQRSRRILEQQITNRTEELRNARDLAANTAENLASSEKKYRSIFDNASEGMFQTSPKGYFQRVNPALARMLGFNSPSDVIAYYTDIAEQLYASPEERTTYLAKLYSENETVGHETRFVRKDGQIIWVHLNSHVIKEDGDIISHIEGTVTDITARKRAERRLEVLTQHLKRAVKERTKNLATKNKELEKANKRLQELDQMKSAFLSSVSHELRTPLTSILGFAKLISRDFDHYYGELGVDDLTAKKGRRILDNLGIIMDQGDRLTRLVNDVLDLNKIESGRMDWNDQVVPPSELIEQAVLAGGGYFSQSSELTLDVDVSPDLPLLYVDPDKILQVLLNLLSNAAKFTSRGIITLKAEQPGFGIVRFSVSDTGIGIALEEQEDIFDKFQQVRQSTTRGTKPAGTGLGLAISKEIVNHYNGQFHLLSETNKGSTFSFDLPVKG